MSTYQVSNLLSSINLVDTTDNTKKCNFSLTGITSGNTRTMSIPNTSDTIVTTSFGQTLSSKTLLCNNCYFADQSDNTKKIGFQSSSATSGMVLTLSSSHTTNRTLNFPDVTDYLVARSSFDTFTNKTITSSTNVVSASQLRTSSGPDVIISSSAQPTVGQVLVATSATTASWQSVVTSVPSTLNGIVYVNSSGVLTANSNLVYDGTGNISYTSSSGSDMLSLYNTQNNYTGTVFSLYCQNPSTDTNTGKLFQFKVINDNYGRVMVYTSGFGFGPGTTTRDVYLYRTMVGQLQLDGDKVSSAANLAVMGNIGIGQSTIASRLHISGNYSSNAWGTSGIGLRLDAATYTDTSSNGTVALNMVNSFMIPILDANRKTTYTNSATVYIDGPPQASSNVILTNPYSLYVNSGNSYFGGIVTLSDTTDSTKKLTFQLSGATTNTTTTLQFNQTANRTISFPDSTDTVCTLNSNQVLVNKTLTLPIISTISNGGTLTLPTGTQTLISRTSTDTISNKSFIDSSTYIIDSMDNSIKLGFSIGGTTGTTTTLVTSQTTNRQITLPDATTTLCSIDLQQNIFNKNLTATSVVFVNSLDTTKQIKFTPAGTTNTSTTITASQTTNRIITLPDATTTLCSIDTSQILTNKSLSDTTTTIVNSIDNTKQIKFTSNGTTATSTTLNFYQTANRVLTFPDTTDTLVTTSFSQNLSNKNLMDSSSIIINSLDNTKQIKFSAIGTTGTATTIATSQTANRTITLPDFTTTLCGIDSSQILSNKTLIDVSTTIADSLDNTIQIKFNAGGTTGTSTTLMFNQTSNQNITFPNSTTTLVGIDTIQVLTNKTLTSPIISTITNTGTLTLPTITDTLVGRTTTDNLSNKSLLNNSCFHVDVTDNTKKIGFQTNTATTGTTLTLISGQSANRSITFPDISDTLVTLSATQNLTNKTLTLPNISTIINTGTLTLPTSTDVLVGRATSDSLTNKTITGSTNTVACSQLRTVGSDVVVAGSSAPATGQALIATSTTSATWQNIATGSDTQVQYNNSGTLSGSTYLTIDTDSTAILGDYTTTNPNVPSTGAKIYSRSRAGRRMTEQLGPFGYNYSFQPCVAMKSIGWFSATGNGTSTTSIGLSMTVTGTATARNVVTTKFFTSLRRIGYVSSSSAGNSAGIRHGGLQFWRGNASGLGGFYFVCRFGISSAATVAGQRSFVGLVASTSVLSNADPSTNSNILGFGVDGSDTTWSFMHAGSSTPATKDTLTGTFAPRSLSTDIYEVRIYCPPNGSTIYYSIEDLNGGSLFDGNTTTALPSNTTLLSPHIWTNNNTTALACAIDVCSLYIETDY
jgi:hypothetical protein